MKVFLFMLRRILFGALIGISLGLVYNYFHKAMQPKKFEVVRAQDK